jgi:hydrogenase maturation protease
MPPRKLVIGLGNPGRGDDAVGPLLARRLELTGLPGWAVIETEADGAALLELWRGAEAVIVIDAGRSGAPPGTIHRLDARTQPIPGQLALSSSHAVGLAEAIELARVWNELPPNFIVYAIEGCNFTVGAQLSPAVETAADEVQERVRREAEQIM